MQQNLPQEQGLLLLKNENKKVANRKRQEGQGITFKSTQDSNKHIKLTAIPNRKRKNISTNCVRITKEKQMKASQTGILERSMKDLMEFQTYINRNIELNGALVHNLRKRWCNTPMFTWLFWFERHQIVVCYVTRL